ncbi:MAG: glycoside hydrolase family 3 C-terminal domain-containing protein [Terriglobia bacterium]|jgi:beta-glucosidase
MRLQKSLVVCSLLIGSLLAWGSALGAQAGGDLPIYLDSKRPVEERINDLLRRMTLPEKVGQLNMPVVFLEHLGKDRLHRVEACKRFAEGTYTDDIGPGGGFFALATTILFDDARQQAEYINQLQDIATKKTRLKIPLLLTEEGTHGGMFPGATVFPEGLALGSTFDMDLVKAIYAAAAAEARSIGVHELCTLVIEPNRDPRLGRNMEGYSEDPYLCGRIATSIVRGAQGYSVAAKDKVVAVLCHYPGQSQPASGMERGAMEISERSLRETFLIPWVAGVKEAGALGVMATYPEIDDVPNHSSERILTHILHEELGFQGLVLSEGNGFRTLVYEGVAATQKEAGALALKAGVDVNVTYEAAYMKPLIENVEEGRVSMALVDRAVRRVLEQKFRLGLFDNPTVDAENAVRIVHAPAYQDLALRAAREGIVLLKNEKALLPLRKALKSLAVIGPDADDVTSQLGDYSPHKVPQHVVTVLEGIKAKVGPKTQVVYAPGCAVMGSDKSGFAEAVRAAKNAEVAIVVVGEKQRSKEGEESTDGEGSDVASLDLTGVQEDLIKAVFETGTPVVVVLINGRPLSTRWTAENVPALVEAWQPGERGGEAVADVLFGDLNPSGRLAITIPRHVGQLPAYYNYKPSKAWWMNFSGGGYVDMPAAPLYPFGYGLSYTRYEYSNLLINPTEIHPGGNAQVRMDVKNAGDRAGEETVQLYLHEAVAPVSIPVKQLRGFQRVALAPGETKTLTFTLTPADLQLLDRDLHWVVVPGDFQIMVGKSSQDIPLKGTLRVTP